jgi:predicted dinucleotide-binding enzyme
MKIGIIGTGTVGQTLAAKLSSNGHEVMIGTRNVEEKLKSTEKDQYGNPSFSEWYNSMSNMKIGSFAETAAWAEVVISATKGSQSISALQLAGKDNLSGKIIIDINNPLDFSNGMPPTLIPSLTNTNSLGEEIQKEFPEAKVVKTLNTMWCGIMVNPSMINNGEHYNFICGNDNDAKTIVRKILNDLGWKDDKTLDLGEITSSRATEAILPIWIRIMMIKGNGAFNFNIV